MIGIEQPEARIAMCKCSEVSGKTYGVRFQRSNKGWKYTWAFEMDTGTAKREGYDNTEITGTINPDKEYPGCPFCGSRHFIICCSCHHLNCQIGKRELFTCAWCGNIGKIVSYDGFGIKSGGDRN